MGIIILFWYKCGVKEYYIIQKGLNFQFNLNIKTKP